MATPTKKIPYEEQIANKFIEALKNGTAPWQKPWKGSELQARAPRGFESGKPYQGANFLMLTMVAMEKNYSDARWLTFNQGKKLGGNVRKGEKATTVQFWKFTEMMDKVDEDGKKVLGEDGKPEKIKVRLQSPKVIYHSVFNAEQFNNLDLKIEPTEPTVAKEFEPIEAAEKILSNSQANIKHIEGNRAYYSSSKDEIVLPFKEQFHSEMAYYSTALHELGHWTGHSSRLDRKLGNGFGTVDYAKEELKAEIGSYILSSKLGVDFDPEQHHAYVASWVQILEDEPKEILRASSDAKKISEFVIGLSQKIEQEKIQEKPLPQVPQAKDRDENVEITTDQNTAISFLKNGNVSRIDIPTASSLIDNYATVQSQINSMNQTYTELDLGEEGKFVLTQINKENSQDHIVVSSLTKRDYWGEDLFTSSDLHLDGDKFVYDSSKMIKYGEDKTMKQNTHREPKTEQKHFKDVYSLLKKSNIKDLKDVAAILKLEDVPAKKTDIIDNIADELSNIYDSGYEESNKINTEIFSFLTNKNELKQVDTLQDTNRTLSRREQEINERADEIYKETYSAHDIKMNDYQSMIEETREIAKKEFDLADAYWEKRLKKDISHKESQASTSKFEQKTYLSVPYKEKEAAKRAGAKWDAQAKSWYAPKGADKIALKDWTVENKEIQNITNSNTNNHTTKDPASELKDILESKGLQLDGMPLLDGKIHRVSMADGKRGNKNGWYVGYQDGRPNAIYGDYTKGQTNAKTAEKWIANKADFSTGYSPEKAAELKALNEEKQQQREAELKQDQLQTADMLEKEFESAKTADKNHPYLNAKNVKAYDLKQDKRGNLLIPLKDESGKLWAVQRIGKPNKDGKTFKMIGVFRTKEEKANGIYHPAKKDGSFFVIDPNKKGLENSSTITITEGYSTGATVFEALNTPVVVAVDSGNLQKVAISIQNKYPEKDILIAGDNDLNNELNGKDNIGKLKAEASALAVNGEASIPTFTKDELKNGASDFNDLAKSRGLSEVKKQLHLALDKLKTKKSEQQHTKTKEQHKDQSKVRIREVVIKQSLSIAK